VSIGVRAKYVVLTPTVAVLVPNGSLFLDAANGNASSIKDISGVVTPINSAEAVTNLVKKQMQTSMPIPINSPVSKRPDGKIEIADSDVPTGQNVIGVTLEPAAGADELVGVLCVGANIIDAISGLGFTVGQEIYISSAGGYTNDPSSFDSMDAVIKIGIADCTSGGASPEARDLVLFPDVVSSI
jgi:hypothetical protein